MPEMPPVCWWWQLLPPSVALSWLRWASPLCSRWSSWDHSHFAFAPDCSWVGSLGTDCGLLASLSGLATWPRCLCCWSSDGPCCGLFHWWFVLVACYGVSHCFLVCGGLCAPLSWHVSSKHLGLGVGTVAKDYTNSSQSWTLCLGGVSWMCTSQNWSGVPSVVWLPECCWRVPTAGSG